MRFLSGLTQLLSRPSASANEPAAPASPAAHGDDEAGEPAREPGLRNTRKRPRRGGGGGGEIVVVDDHDRSPTVSLLVSSYLSLSINPVSDLLCSPITPAVPP